MGSFVSYEENKVLFQACWITFGHGQLGSWAVGQTIE
jgi:hypothetical protein